MAQLSEPGGAWRQQLLGTRSQEVRAAAPGQGMAVGQGRVGQVAMGQGCVGHG